MKPEEKTTVNVTKKLRKKLYNLKYKLCFKSINVVIELLLKEYEKK